VSWALKGADAMPIAAATANAKATVCGRILKFLGTVTVLERECEAVSM
jgi:hypothetical protein